MSSRIQLVIVIFCALLSDAYGQSKPANAPIPPRGVPPDVKTSSLPPADVMLAESKALRRQADFILMEQFRKDVATSQQLTRELSQAVKLPVDGRVEKSINKKGREFDRLVIRMIRWLDDRKPSAERNKTKSDQPLTESIQSIVRLMDAVAPQLNKLLEMQDTTLNIELARDVTDQLIAIQRLSRRFL